MISYFIIHVKHRSRKCLQCEVYFILFFMPLYNASCLPRLYRKKKYIYIYQLKKIYRDENEDRSVRGWKF